MQPISRRRFVQFAGSTLATLGLSQSNFLRQAESQSKVLAKSTSRKVALLVGINDYKSSPLQGCLSDVELQRHLLQYGFGFNKADIHTLTNSQATRENILQAFEEYLIKQAKPDDVVVFHFSGHGSRIADPDPVFVSLFDNTDLNGTLVPIDAVLPPGYPQQGGQVKDIMGHTLFLLMASVKSENFTAVLDSCFSGGATREFRVRSREGGRNIQIVPAEKAYQENLLSKLNLKRQDFIKRYRKGVAKGVVLAATDPNQLAADAQLNGFYAGAFTYLFTQYLWQKTNTPETTISYVKQHIPDKYNQTPIFETKAGSGDEKQPIYFISNPSVSADAVITAVTGNQARLWLSGVDVGNVDTGTVFAVVNGSGKVIYQSREGLEGKGIVQGVVKEGALLRKVG
ncbi:MAG: caspase family protein [Rhizonema sp. PD38]|nr:caspase family protein [Rhizonema sp. PD38]